MRPLFQEAPFACFEDDASESPELSSLPHFTISGPPGHSPPLKSFTRVRAVDCTGSGTFFYRHETFRGRFVCWRVFHHVLVLREYCLNTSLTQAGVRLTFEAPVVPTSVFAVESWDDDAVTIHVVTHAGTIHRFTYSVPVARHLSIFSNANAKAYPEPQPATRRHDDAIQTLQADEVVTVAMWVNEYTVVVGTDAGRVLGVNFGLPREVETRQEFVFTDGSVMTWLWHGLVRTTTATLRASGDTTARNHVGDAVVAMTSFQLANDDEYGNENDVCLVTVSADCVLRAWSFGSHSCLGKQQLNHVVQVGTRTDDERMTQTDDETDTCDDASATRDVCATQVKVVALPPTESANCRLLLHVATTAAPSSDIYLLRGDVQSSVASRGDELALETARVFTVPSSGESAKRGLRLVDFAVDSTFLFSSWRSVDGDEVYVHPKPMALTGPKRSQGQVVRTVDRQRQQFEAEDTAWLVECLEESELTRIDDFFTERLLVPGRFSRQNLVRAMTETHRGALNSSPLVPGYKVKEVLIRFVDRHCSESTAATRVRVWQDLIKLCTQQWRWENVPIGFAPTTNALLPGAPVMLRRNRVSLFFPSAPLIIATFSIHAEPQSASGECVAELVHDVLPVVDAFPSQSFQTYMRREVANVASDWKVEAAVALARHCVRLGLTSTTLAESNCTAEVVLTRAIVRLSKLLGADATFHEQVFHDLVKQLYPFDLVHGPQAYRSLSCKRSHDSEKELANHKDERGVGDAAGAYDANATRACFAGFEMCFAFDQMAARTIEEMCRHSLRVVLLLAFLVDSRPGFLRSATLSTIERVNLPQSISIYQRWRLSQWVASHGVSHPIINEGDNLTVPTVMPPLLQKFLLDNNRLLTRSDHFKRALSVLQLAHATNNVQRQDLHSVLATFTWELLHLVSQPNDAIVQLLRQCRQFRLLRTLLCCNLRDLSLHQTTTMHANSLEQVHHYMRSIGECLAYEGQVAATQTRDATHAQWCFQQAIRCFTMCLAHFFVESKHGCVFLADALDPFIYDVVGLLKETLPRGYYDQLLGFLWTVLTQALSHFTHEDGAQSLSVQMFLWVNVFKYSVEEQSFRDAHLALKHVADLSAASSGPEVADETASECATFFIKELFRYGHSELICELHWGVLEGHVEKYLLWQAAHATIIKSEGLDATAKRYYYLLFAFYLRKHQPANAASSLYAFALRLRLATSTSQVALEAQRDALNAACNSLRALPAANRWVVRKLHTEELPMAKWKGNEATQLLHVVTLEEMRREVAILDGKLRLLAIGHSESLLLSTIEGDEVIALLLDAVYSSCQNVEMATVAERRRAGTVAVEVATDIATRSSSASLCGLTKSLARYCSASEQAVASSVARVDRELLWELLERVLLHVDSLIQYEVAAETVLDYWHHGGRKIELPLWLRKRLSRGNPAKLLQLYLKHGLLSEGLQLVESLVSNGMETIKSEVEVQTLRAGIKLSQLPWIPYNLVDGLLDATAAVLNDGTRSNVSKDAIAKLRDQELRLRQQMMRYLTSVHALEQGQEAANLAHSGIEMK